MKNLFVVLSMATLFSCSKPKPVPAFIPSKEIQDMKDKIAKLEQIPIGGYEEELKAMKLNTAIAEMGALDSYLMKVRTEKFDELGRKLTDEELVEIKKQSKYDSLSTQLNLIIQENK